MELTIVQKLDAANSAVTDLTAKLTAAQTEAADKITALETSVTALTGERDTFKAQAEKSAADLNAAQAEIGNIKAASDALALKVQGLEAKLADPSFKAAGTPGTDPVPQGGSTDKGEAVAALQAAYDKETDPVRKSEIGAQLVTKLEGK